MNTSKEVLVLAYHGISDKENFEKQLIYLKSQYHFIGAGELLAPSKRDTESKKSVLITFDDGNKSLYTSALPILKKYNIPAIAFVVTNIINTNKPYWWDEVEYYLGRDEGRKKVREIKTWKNKDSEAFLIEIRKKSKKPALKYPQLTTAELLEMKDAGISIANHSHTHPMFDQCTEEEFDNELLESTTTLKSLNLTPEVFAYPNGNYSKLAEQKLKEYGIKSAFLFDHKINRGEIKPLQISRLVVNDSTPLWKFKFILSGWHSKILPLTKALGKIR